MSAVPARRLERRSELDSVRTPERAPARASGRSAVRTAPGQRSAPAARKASAPAAHRSNAPLARRADRRAAPRPAAPLPAEMAEQIFRTRVEGERNIARSRERHLRSIPKPRRFASLLAPVIVVVFLAMLGITTFQTRMAQTQVEIDQLQRKIDGARATKVSLERQRAELRSPVRLGREAEAMGMVQASSVGFVQVDSDTYVAAIAASGQMTQGSDGSTP